MNNLVLITLMVVIYINIIGMVHSHQNMNDEGNKGKVNERKRNGHFHVSGDAKGREKFNHIDKLKKSSKNKDRKSFDNKNSKKKGNHKKNWNVKYRYSSDKKVEELAGCVKIHEAEYRTIDGKYNKQGRHPIRGAAGTPFVRLLSSDYDDDTGFPKGIDPTKLYNGYPLPLPRSVTLAFDVENFTETDTHTPWITQWGQIVTHDIVDRALFECDDDLDCSDCEVVDNFCTPIIFPAGDPFFEGCRDNTRDAPVCGTGVSTKSPREQMNRQTVFLDASVVYGESEERLCIIRNLTNELGLLKVGQDFGPTGKSHLPQRNDDEELATAEVDFCFNPRQRCFVAGDHRATQNWGLISIQTLLLREHNRLATELHEINPHWHGEKLFMEARKILGAEMQQITFVEFLPVLLGEEKLKNGIGEYSGYDKRVNPGAISSFVSGAFRIHNFNKPIVDRLDENFEEIPEGSVFLTETNGRPNQLFDEGGIDPVVRGMGAPNKDQTDVTHTLFTAHNFLDLATRDIQRSREYGLRPYVAWRKYCGLSKARKFDQLASEITNHENRQKLEALYGTTKNIDLWIAGVLEDPVNGGLVGPTFGCLIEEQFRRMRDGDKFYYENPGVFTADQLSEIRKYTLARLTCDNGDAIERVQKNVFIPVKDKSEYLNCSDIPNIDLTKWKEEDTCEQDVE